MKSLISYLYIAATFIICGQAVLNRSLTMGVLAMAGSALCYFGAAGFVGSYHARRDIRYKPAELLGIGGIAIVLVVVGVTLMEWSGLLVDLFGLAIAGPIWAALGIIVAAITTGREHA